MCATSGLFPPALASRKPLAFKHFIHGAPQTAAADPRYPSFFKSL